MHLSYFYHDFRPKHTDRDKPSTCRLRDKVVCVLYLRGDVRIISDLAANRHVGILQRHHDVQHIHRASHQQVSDVQAFLQFCVTSLIEHDLVLGTL